MKPEFFERHRLQNLNRRTHLCVAIGWVLLMGLPGCTLFWGESPLDRPVRESQFCENGLDDDLDGVFDCDDPDCAWAENCFQDPEHHPYGLIECRRPVSEIEDQFDRASVAAETDGCSAIDDENQFTGSQVVCGQTAELGELGYRLQHWVWHATQTCQQAIPMITLNACVPDDADACDAPIMVCADHECTDFQVLLNDLSVLDQGAEQPGLVSQDLGFFMDQVDYFEVETKFSRLTTDRSTVDDGDEGDGRRVIPCQSLSACETGCEVIIDLKPAETAVVRPQLQINVSVDELELTSISYSVAGRGRIEDLIDQSCAALEHRYDSEAPLMLNVSGPYFLAEPEGNLSTFLVVSTTESQDRKVLCHVPWAQPRDAEGVTEYLLGYRSPTLQSGGKLLLDGMTFRKRERPSATSAECGLYQNGLFGGDRTLCDLPSGPSLRVWVAELNRGRKLAAKRLSSGEFSWYIEIDQLMFRTHVTGEPFLDEQDQLMDLIVLAEDEDSVLLKVWYQSPDERVGTLILELTEDQDASSFDLTVVERSFLDGNTSSPLGNWRLRPSDIFALPVFDAYQFGMFQLRDEIVSLYTAPEGARDWTRRTSARLPAAATEKLNRPETKIINLTAVTVGSPRTRFDASKIFVLIATETTREDGKLMYEHHLMSALLVFENDVLTLRYEEAVAPYVREEGWWDVPVEDTACVGNHCLLTRGGAAIAFNERTEILSIYTPTPAAGRRSINRRSRPQICEQTVAMTSDEDIGAKWQRVILQTRGLQN